MYQNVYFEICGICNGECPYCVTGKRCVMGRNKEEIRARKLVDISEFEQALIYLEEKKIIDPATSKIGLYNWGEPFLHSELEKLLAVVTKRGLRYNLSTNCSIYKELNPYVLKNLNTVLFSMPGFSQASYDRIHGFNFERIKANIRNMTMAWRSQDYRGGIAISFHLYQFNIYEIFTAAQFAKELGIGFAPNYASFNGHNLMKSYLSDSMDRNVLKKSTSELMTYFLQDIKRPDGYCCQQLDMLAINEHCEVLLCCSVERGLPTYALGKLFDLSLDEIEEKKRNTPYCGECIGLNMDYVGHAFPKVRMG